MFHRSTYEGDDRYNSLVSFDFGASHGPHQSSGQGDVEVERDAQPLLDPFVRHKPLPSPLATYESPIDRWRADALRSSSNSKETKENGGVGSQGDNGGQIARWLPGFWRRMPVLAIFSLLGVLACTGAAIAILVVSDGQPVDQWASSFGPSVYLAIIAIVANMLLALALTEGLAISFWRTALNGCTIEELNRNWLSGRSVRQAFLGWRQGGRITGLACLFSVLSLLRGPLNQRASQVQSNVPFETQGTLQFRMAPRLPDGYTGVSVYARGVAFQTSRLTPPFTRIMQEYSANRNVTINHSPCGKSCTATVKGFGFGSNCTIKNITWSQDDPAFDQTIFDTSVDLFQLNQTIDPATKAFTAGIQLNATFNNGTEPFHGWEPATGYLTSHVCTLKPGTVAYKVNIDGGTISLLSDRSEDEFLAPITLPSPSANGGNTTIGGFQYAGNYVFSSTGTMHFGGAVSSASLNGSLANQQIANTSEMAEFDYYISFNDPMDVMLDGLREIAFRASVRAAQDNASLADADQNVPYAGSDERTIYVTDRRYLAAAAAISLTSVVAVAATLWGWWELGREVSSSPLEIAKAFGAPLLQSMGSNAPWDRIPQNVARTRVRFGESAEHGGMRRRSTSFGAFSASPKRLVLARENDARKPVAGALYGE